MNRTLFAAVAALALIGASTQVSFAQSQNGWSGGHWQNDAANEGNQNGPAGPARRWGPPPPPPPEQTAAKFVFRHGRSRVAVTCPQADLLQDCIHAATVLASNLTRIHERALRERHSSDEDQTGSGATNQNSAQPSGSDGASSSQQMP